MIVYLCPTDKKYACSWEGSSNDILDHFNHEHEDLLFYSNSFTIDLSNTSENQLFFIDEEIYLTQIKISADFLTLFLRYLGPAKIASKITYDIRIEINAETLDKKYISVTEKGGFEINLNLIKELYGDIQHLNATLEISGDFKSNSSDDGVFLEYEASPQCDKVDAPYLNFVPSPERKRSLDEHKKITIENAPAGFEGKSLVRSKTINYEEIKRRTFVKRCHSTKSLECIQENDFDLNCRNCRAILLAPIFLCPCGQNFCAQCASSICKICMEEITEERNIELEEKCSNYLHNCKNKKQGCTQKFVYKELHQHEINCKYCDYKCPMEECCFTGQFKTMQKHLKLIHSSVKMLESFIVVFEKYNEALLLNEERGIFYCNCNILLDSVVWEARFCGPKEKRFFCELKFKDGKLKKPLLLRKIEDVYSVQISFQELKRLRLKSKNAVLAITC